MALFGDYLKSLEGGNGGNTPLEQRPPARRPPGRPQTASTAGIPLPTQGVMTPYVPSATAFDVLNILNQLAPKPLPAPSGVDQTIAAASTDGGDPLFMAYMRGLALPGQMPAPPPFQRPAPMPAPPSGYEDPARRDWIIQLLKLWAFMQPGTENRPDKVTRFAAEKPLRSQHPQPYYPTDRVDPAIPAPSLTRPPRRE